MKLTYAGHSAVFVEQDGYVVAIDPWLQANPRCPDILKNPKKLDLIALTHGHSDHAGDTVRLQKLTNAKVAALFELYLLLAEDGVPEENLIGMGKGGTVKIDQVKVSLTHALHSNSYETSKRGRQYAGEPCGVVLQVGGRTIYHAGDTALFSDMTLIRDTYAPELAFLPIGDHFTMGAIEAAKAANWLGVKRAVPIHFKTFGLLAQDATSFVEACASYGVEAIELAPGQTLEI